MIDDFLIGVIALGVAGGLIYFGLPDKQGVSPRFLRFEALMILFPSIVLVFLAGGVAELLTGFFLLGAR